MKHDPAHGLICSVCQGLGFLEPMSVRLQHRTGPFIAIFIIIVVAVTVNAGHEKHFSEVLAFLGTLTGAITGFYFSKKK